MARYKKQAELNDNVDIKEDTPHYFQVNNPELITGVKELLEWDVYKLFSIHDTFQNLIEMTSPIKSKFASVNINYHIDNEWIILTLRCRYAMTKVPSIYKNYIEYGQACNSQYTKYLTSVISNNNFNFLDDVKDPTYVSVMSKDKPGSSALNIKLDKDKIDRKLSVFIDAHNKSSEFEIIRKYMSSIYFETGIEFFGEKSSCTMVHDIPMVIPTYIPQFTDAFLKMTCILRDKINHKFNLTHQDNLIAG